MLAGPSGQKNQKEKNMADGKKVYVLGDCRYLKPGYFEVIDAELKGLQVSPRFDDAINAHAVLICLDRAKRAGIAVPDYYITTKNIRKLPALVYAMNPYTCDRKIVTKKNKIKAMRTLTRNYMYPVCVQKIDGPLKEIIGVCGLTTARKYQKLVKKIWQIFNVPLVKLIIMGGKKIKLSAIDPIEIFELGKDELKLLKKIKGADLWEI